MAGCSAVVSTITSQKEGSRFKPATYARLTGDTK